MHIDRIPVYRVYQRAIDLELYHAFAELVVQTSQDDTARRTYRQTRAMQIWQVETDVSGYFEPYHLRYPGEVLERFEEKLGNDVRVLRALALALGNTCAIQSDNMFVGNQRGAFLQKLRRSAGEDVYLQGALYLLETDAAQRHALLEKLAERECTRTEEALFVLSLYTITDITDPVEVQSYIEQQGGEYTADIMAVHQVTFTDYTANDITDPAEIKAYLESQGQEYNENITAIHQITFIDGEATPEGSLCEVEK